MALVPGDAAFPLTLGSIPWKHGISQRDYVAICAMQALIAVSEGTKTNNTNVVEKAYEYADLMIRQSRPAR